MIYKILLVGCGSISREELKGLVSRDDVTMVGLVELNEAAARDRATEFDLKDAAIETDLAKALRELQPDVVVDCTVPSAHASVTIAALESGCHVLGQKPMADTLENARRMVKTASQAKGRYGVIQTTRHQAAVKALRQFIASGRIGRAHTLESRFFMGMHFENDFRLQMDHVLLLDMAIHAFDAARFVSGKDALSVFAQDWNPPGSWFKHGASAAAFFNLSDDSRFVYHGSWCAAGCPGSEWRVIGSEGTAVLKEKTIHAERGVWTSGFRADIEDVSIPVEPSSARDAAHAGAVNDFFDALREDRDPISPAADNIKSLAMVLAAIKSCETGRVEKVEA